MKWYEITFMFEATQDEADALLDQIGDLVCGNERCEEEQECSREWTGSMTDVTKEIEDEV